MKKLVLFLTIVFFSSLNAQENRSSDSNDVLPHICGSSLIHDYLFFNDSLYSEKIKSYEEIVKNTSQKNSQTTSNYVIPVVVHVMHKGEAIGTGTNISDESILDKIKLINDDFRKSVGTKGYGNGVDTQIEFALAVRNPMGQCTNGINRVNMSSFSDYMAYGIRFQSGLGMLESTLKGMSFWDSNSYYNIWIVSEIDNNNGFSGYQGYALFSAAHGQSNDGAVILSSSFSDPISRTETHELGHALNLYHSFEGDGAVGTSCPTANGCGPGVGDCCGDIPPHKRSSNSCNLSGTNSCDGNSSNTLFSQNYMDYSAHNCKFMFTSDQKNRMITAINAQRFSLLAVNGNNKLIPASSPIANFESDKQTICAGETVSFLDKSSCIPNTYLNNVSWPGISFSWTLANGSVSMSSTLQNPKFKITVPGNYTLTYRVTNSYGSNTLVVPNAVIVSSSAVLACIPSSNFVGFTGNSVFNVAFSTISNFTPQFYNQGYRDFSCVKNTTVNANQNYVLTIKASTGLFDYIENITAYIDYNNNGIFETNERIIQGQVPLNSSNYTLSSNVLIPNSAVNNTFLRMRVIGSSNLITDNEINCISDFNVGDIEDYGVKVVNSLSNQDFDYNNFSYFPNPVKNELNIVSEKMIEKVRIHSILGELIFESDYNSGNIKIDFSRYPNSMYVFTVFSNDKVGSFKILKE